ncbi:TIGR00282 family metallophosphoesterase [Oceanispirochaeta sp.]|jgi:metallophosphoesterase (TIGR00282 family)|uniref:TIGR00282 family metallophosphoesterase n=1 Tax=Oceanispirochaeta sp. TaxID=2035350 RepID=UPI00261ED4B8|nr:TIGR00282 family metallophosphoesterase [Oceanispirochaeta sp.]MDA3957191.1 TIGR00282 family metallophosphoesterase [Oceanispirochaeta sp.]
MRILFIGEIVSKAGVFTVKKLLPKLKEEKNLDFVVANGNGVTGGFGMGMNHSLYLKKLGLDAITSGECVFYKKDMVGFIPKASFLIRPANYPPGSPGRGWGIYNVGDQKIAIISLLGQSGYQRVHLSNPFSYVTDLISRVKETTPHIIVNFHATTTAEKQTLAYIVDGHASAMIGTGTKAITADAGLMKKGTAMITDAGRCGSLHSVGGLEKNLEIQKFLTQIPERSQDAWDQLEMQGVLLDLDDQGKARSIETLRIPCTEKPDDTTNNR